MVSGIRMYIEGGGKGSNKNAEIAVRQGFSGFFKELKALANNRLKVIACGSREATFKDFRMSLRNHPDHFNVLLVDSDGPVATSAWEYLRDEVGWNMQGIDDDRCHLMVQVMEAWLLADVENLKKILWTRL